MRGQASGRSHKPRELRRRVIVPARLRQESGWSDASILNISSRGLLIHTARPLEPGSQVELRKGEHVIRARVVWRDAGKAGLRAEHRLPVEEIASPDVRCEFQPGATERRRRPRTAADYRSRGRTIEFAAILGIVFTLAALAATIAQQAIAQPLASVSNILG